MVAVEGLGQAMPQQAPQVQSNPQDLRVTQVSKPIFQRVKETLSSAWSATVIGVKAAGDKISFVFFRVLEWIHPSLGPKVENVFLRIGNVFRSIKGAWRQEEIRKEMEHLRVENHDFRAQVQRLSGTAEQNERLKLDLSQLQGENGLIRQTYSFLEQEKAGQDQRYQAILRQQDHIRDRESAVVRQRDMIVGQNAQLQKEKEELTVQRTKAVQALTLALAMSGSTWQQLDAAQQEVADLRRQMESNRAMTELLDPIVRACDQVRQVGQKTEIDDNLEKLIPFLLQQIRDTRTRLSTAKETLLLAHPHSSAQVPLQSLERILAAVVESLEKIPQALKLHAHWQESVGQLLGTQQGQV